MDRLKPAVNINVKDNYLCAVELYSGGSSCDRELGGGVICSGPGSNKFLCGIQSFRYCWSSMPSVFTDVASFNYFIEQGIKQLQKQT